MSDAARPGHTFTRDIRKTYGNLNEHVMSGLIYEGRPRS